MPLIIIIIIATVFAWLLQKTQKGISISFFFVFRLFEDDFEADEELAEDDILDLKGNNSEEGFGSHDIVKRDPPWTFVADVDDAYEEEYFQTRYKANLICFLCVKGSKESLSS